MLQCRLWFCHWFCLCVSSVSPLETISSWRKYVINLLVLKEGGQPPGNQLLLLFKPIVYVTSRQMWPPQLTSAAPYAEVNFSTVLCGALKCYSVQCSAVQFSAVQYHALWTEIILQWNLLAVQCSTWNPWLIASYFTSGIFFVFSLPERRQYEETK